MAQPRLARDGRDVSCVSAENNVGDQFLRQRRDEVGFSRYPGNRTNVPSAMDWVQLLALTGGLVAALAFVAGRLDLARSDAAAVYVITKPVPIESNEQEYRPGKYEVHNDGPLPILSVFVFVWEGESRRRRTWRLRPPEAWMTGRSTVDGFGYPIVAPRSSTEEADLLGGMADPYWTGDPPQVMLIFLDGRGRYWVRWPDGRLSRLRPPPVVRVFSPWWRRWRVW
jgi:hypothetical protein